MYLLPPQLRPFTFTPPNEPIPLQILSYYGLFLGPSTSFVVSIHPVTGDQVVEGFTQAADSDPVRPYVTNFAGDLNRAWVEIHPHLGLPEGQHIYRVNAAEPPYILDPADDPVSMPSIYSRDRLRERLCAKHLCVNGVNRQRDFMLHLRARIGRRLATPDSKMPLALSPLEARRGKELVVRRP